MIIASVSAVTMTASEPVFAGNIDTLSSWNGTTSIGQFGASGSTGGLKPTDETYGEVITPDSSQTTLTSFKFALEPSTKGTRWQFRPYVFAWDGTGATGTSLFTGGSQTLVGDNAFHIVTANTGNLSLIAGHQYVIFLSMANPTDFDNSSSPGPGVWGINSTNAYSGGQFVFQGTGDVPANLTAQPWDTSFTTTDLAFTASFKPLVAPEASSLLLLALPAVFLIRKRDD